MLQGENSAMAYQIKEAANAIRALAIDAIAQANSGHPGMPMGMADIAEVLWGDCLKHNPADPYWSNRDRFVLSNGHGSMLLYALLHLSGYAISMDDLKNFRQIDSITAGHPEYDLKYGIEMTTGPLGQGLASAIGMALAEKMLAAKFNRDQFPIVDHHTYVFAGDGDLMEGVSHEACALAGTWQLGKLIVIWDDNGISIDGKTIDWMTTNVPERFQAYGWHVIADVDGHDATAIEAAIKAAKEATDKPTIICAKTHIGFGAPNKQDTAGVHGAPLGDEESQAAKKALNWVHAPFEIPETIYQRFDARQKGQATQESWQSLFDAYEKAYPELAAEFLRRSQAKLPAHFDDAFSAYLQSCPQSSELLATRQASAKVIAFLASQLPELIGGSADLTGSNGTAWPEMVSLRPHNANGFDANYIHYGVREFGMSAIMNGMQLHRGFRIFGGTFLAFSDYARAAVRLSALMCAPVIYIYTHDSIGLGEDGPTHQPVEQASSLRLIPHLHVWRPADLTETAVAWDSAIHYQGPSALLLSRQKVPAVLQDQKLISDCKCGAYILKDTGDNPTVIIFATGTEVSLALEVADKLAAKGQGTRVVSVPCMEVFQSQDQSYKDKVLSKSIKLRVAIEAGVGALWYPFVGEHGLICAVDDFGHSGPYQKIYAHFGLTDDMIAEQIEQHEGGV
jgi:transketolase